MSPEQLRTLQKLSHMFEEGLAGPKEIKLLSELLATINHHKDFLEEQNIQCLNKIMEPF
ncbi:hypothetical protein tinsulaeT_14300 [Thalassotalea insulae]|uniref:Uncharacterized protein n=1 Tax=Thalassotalea insulae TaxID=2056778 RepID=A0ABQ6GQ39_9GAMM|nr:hypothetical protein [Thalassotalea insulae]GLX78090.1 hypothetical protein tinsulaeT_14300 [Thalassotalea insulae]